MISFLLTGCWNYREIDKYAIVSGLAIDKNEKGDGFLLTAEVIDIRPGMNEVKISSIRVEAEGNTIFDAIRNMIKISGKRLYWGHAKIVIISQDVAKDSIIPIVDWISRDQEPRLTTNILVSIEKTANELLSQESVTTEIRSFEMSYMLVGNRVLSKAPKVGVYELMNDLSCSGISPVLPTISITTNEGKRTSELSGIAAFKGDKLIGFLDGEDAKFYLFIKDKIESALLVAKIDEGNSIDNITLEAFKNKTKIKPVYDEGKLLMKIHVRTEVVISEEDKGRDYISEKGRAKLKTYAEATLEKDIENVIKKVQSNFKSDIFGFGKIVRAEMPSLWKDIKNDWDDIFNNLEVEVKAEIQIRNSGLTISPIKVGE